MSDNTVLPGSGEAVRDLDKGGIKTQVMALDVGGAGVEKLLSIDNPLPAADAESNGLLRRILALLSSPRGYDKSTARQRVTAAIESGTVTAVTAVTTVTTVTTVSNLSSIDGRNAVMLINPTNRTSWALNVRARIT